MYPAISTSSTEITNFLPIKYEVIDSYNDPVITSHFDVRAQCRVTQLMSFLLTMRFLILIDDVWDDKVWDNLHICFKDTLTGSRFILTTRLSNLANYAKCESEPHHLRLFRDDESWTLLQQELFQGKICLPEIVDVGF
ncbi:hypothetical protein H5410_055648 [Solanum commersonii]|uniref:NB-ARC domain-containing protein n=1 Tax=Solanum commersonii TaxID=4109 RepID=A0A9J5WIX4_SOLCO|nr:hypothetical protein H5410_055648 [Solanum commersonii]